MLRRIGRKLHVRHVRRGLLRLCRPRLGPYVVNIAKLVLASACQTRHEPTRFLLLLHHVRMLLLLLHHVRRLLLLLLHHVRRLLLLLLYHVRRLLLLLLHHVRTARRKRQHQVNHSRRSSLRIKHLYIHIIGLILKHRI